MVLVHRFDTASFVPEGLWTRLLNMLHPLSPSVSYLPLPIRPSVEEMKSWNLSVLQWTPRLDVKLKVVSTPDSPQPAGI